MAEVSDYHRRCAAFVEGVREAFGYGYGAGDIEHMFEIFTARNLWFLKHNNENPRIAKATEDAINAMTAGRRPAPVIGTAMDAAIEEARRKRDG